MANGLPQVYLYNVLFKGNECPHHMKNIFLYFLQNRSCYSFTMVTTLEVQSEKCCFFDLIHILSSGYGVAVSAVLSDYTEQYTKLAVFIEIMLMLNNS
jgi:hypothetical protein